MILVNGAQSTALNPQDRGLAYGDGVFRTLLLRSGKPVAWLRHYAKIANDCARLALPCPAREILAADLAGIAAEAPDCVVKIIVTRGAGQRGYAPPVPADTTRIVTASPLPAYPASYREEGIVARVCRLRLAQQPALAGVKHLNRLENVLARGEWDDPAIAEGILLDQAGWVIGGTMSNLFMVQGDSLVTPDLSASGVAGVTRERILALAPRLGLQAEVRVFGLNELLAADEVMVCNSVIGVWRVRQMGTRHWSGARLATALRELLEEAID